MNMIVMLHEIFIGIQEQAKYVDTQIILNI